MFAIRGPFAALGGAFVAGTLFLGLSQLVSVPFEFTVGKATLPAGDYVVTRRGANVVEFRSAESDAAAVATTSPLAVDEAGERAQIVFNRYDNAYFVAAVQTLDGTMSLKGSRSKGEQQLAKAGVRAEIVAIAAK